MINCLRLLRQAGVDARLRLAGPPGNREVTAIIKAAIARSAVMTAKFLRSRMARSTLWTSLAVMCSRGSVVFALMCAARLLDIEDFGRLMIVQSTCVVFQSFFIVGFMITAPKLIADLRHRDPKRTAEVIAMLRILGLALGLAVAGLLVILAPQIAGIVFGRPELSQLLRIASVIFIVMTWHEIQMAIINGFEAFDLQARVAILAAPVGLTVFLSATWLGGLEGSVLGLMAMFAVAAVVSTWSVSRLCRRHAIPIHWWSGSRDWSTVCRIALPAALSGAVWLPAIWIANAFLVNSEDGLAQFGLFSLANQFFAAIMFLPNMVTVVVMPAFSRQLGGRTVGRRRASPAAKRTGHRVCYRRGRCGNWLVQSMDHEALRR